MFDTHRVEIEWGGRKLSLETGRVARQADAAVFRRWAKKGWCRPVDARHLMVVLWAATRERRRTNSPGQETNSLPAGVIADDPLDAGDHMDPPTVPIWSDEVARVVSTHITSFK